MMSVPWGVVLGWFRQILTGLIKSNPRYGFPDLDSLTYCEIRRLAETSPHLLADIGMEGLSSADFDSQNVSILAGRDTSEFADDRARNLPPKGVSNAVSRIHSKREPARSSECAKVTHWALDEKHLAARLFYSP